MLRKTIVGLIGLALLTTIACVALATIGVVGLPVGFGIWLALQLAIVLAGFAFERISYKSLETAEPGPGWLATSERFIDPATGAHVRVWFNAETGERRYVTGVATT